MASPDKTPQADNFDSAHTLAETIADRAKDGLGTTEDIELARAFLAAAEAWENFDQQELDRILLGVQHGDDPDQFEGNIGANIAGDRYAEHLAESRAVEAHQEEKQGG